MGALRGEAPTMRRTPLDRTCAGAILPGLYAFFTDDLGLARQQWLLAKGNGLDNPRVVAGELWTPGAAEAFANAR